MTRLKDIISAVVVAGVAVWLLVKTTQGYLLTSGLVSAVMALILYIPIAIAEWLCFRRTSPRSRLLILICPYGLSVFLAIYMSLILTSQINLVSRPGLSTKEMEETSWRANTPLEVRPRWYENQREHVRSERNQFIVMALVLLLLYIERARQSDGGLSPAGA